MSGGEVWMDKRSIDSGYFFAREGTWDVQTRHLLSFAISARNVAFGGRGGGDISPFPTLCINLYINDLNQPF